MKEMGNIWFVGTVYRICRRLILRWGTKGSRIIWLQRLYLSLMSVPSLVFKKVRTNKKRSLYARQPGESFRIVPTLQIVPHRWRCLDGKNVASNFAAQNLNLGHKFSKSMWVSFCMKISQSILKINVKHLG